MTFVFKPQRRSRNRVSARILPWASFRTVSVAYQFEQTATFVSLRALLCITGYVFLQNKQNSPCQLFKTQNISARAWLLRTYVLLYHQILREQTFLADRALCGDGGKVKKCWACFFSITLPLKPNNKAQCAKSKKKGYYEAFRLLLANLVKADRLAIGHPSLELASVRRCLKMGDHGRDKLLNRNLTNSIEYRKLFRGTYF